MTEAEEIIAQLHLQPLQPEGGYFVRTWTSTAVASRGDASGTAIYFLITSETFSAFHRLKAEELWHFYAGDSVEHFQLRDGMPPVRTRLGSDVLGGEQPQLAIAAGTWQAACIDSVRGTRGWSLLGCTMTPGWREEHFELGRAAELCANFPQEFQSLAKLCRL